MYNITTMIIPYNFKIRRISDIETFIKDCMVNGNEYCIVTDSGVQFVFSKDKDGEVSVATRDGDLKDIFNPLIEIAKTDKLCYEKTVIDYIWQNRKYINSKWFSNRKEY